MRYRLLFALLAASSIAQAGLFDDDEARKRIEQIRTELNDVSARLETVNRNQLNFSNQSEAIKVDIAKLRGQIEVLTYELEAAQKRQKDFYVDLDNRLRKLEQPVADSSKDNLPASDAAAESKDYEAALSLVKSSKFSEAALALSSFIKAWPNSTMLSSAHYWGGYAYSQIKDYSRAADLFGKFVSLWPEDERAPIALESQASSFEMLKETRAARAALEMLAAKYPNSEPGKRAKWRLKKK